MHEFTTTTDPLTLDVADARSEMNARFALLKSFARTWVPRPMPRGWTDTVPTARVLRLVKGSAS